MKRYSNFAVLAVLLASGVVTAQESSPAVPADKGQETVEQMLVALGGEKFLAVKDIVRRGRVYYFNRGDLANPGDKFVNYVKFPGKERHEEAKGKNVYLYNSDQGWELDKQGIREMTPEQIESFNEGNRHDFEYLLRYRARGEKMQIYYLGREFADNRRVHAVELVDERGDSYKLYVDARTYLPAQLHYRQRDLLSGEWIDMVEYYGKYVNVQGIQTPMQLTRERARLRSLEVHITEVQYNAGITDELFTLPSLEAHWQKVK